MSYIKAKPLVDHYRVALQVKEPFRNLVRSYDELRAFRPPVSLWGPFATCIPENYEDDTYTKTDTANKVRSRLHFQVERALLQYPYGTRTLMRATGRMTSIIKSLAKRWIISIDCNKRKAN